jgi:hypothetical protein
VRRGWAARRRPEGRLPGAQHRSGPCRWAARGARERQACPRGVLDATFEATVGIPHIVARVFGKSLSGESRAWAGNSGNLGVKSRGFPVCSRLVSPVLGSESRRRTPSVASLPHQSASERIRARRNRSWPFLSPMRSASSRFGLERLDFRACSSLVVASSPAKVALFLCGGGRQ